MWEVVDCPLGAREKKNLRQRTCVWYSWIVHMLSVVAERIQVKVEICKVMS